MKKDDADINTVQANVIGPKKPAKDSYRKHKKTYCERCGFIAEDKCQLDVHHLDKDHTNNRRSNLQTLCANCHRLQHFA